MRLFNFVTAFVLLMASAANSAKVTPAKARSMFRKAMEYSQFDEGINKNKIMKDMLSKATFVKGRKLAEGNQDEGWDDFGFDVSQYSVKYSGCSVVQTYSDEMAEDETTDTVLVGKKFVIFRLCPSQSCNKYTVTGCTEDYGEYLIEIGDYLEAVSNFYQEKSKRFCEYCLPCYQNGQSSGGDGAGDNGGRRHLADVADEADAGDAGDAADEADAAENGNAAAEETCDDTVCTDSYSLCYKADGDEAMDVHDFMNCAAVEYNNVEYYLAPHCSSDGFTVKLGVYSDDECSTFVKSMSVDTVLGFSLDSTIFSTYFPKTCTSCLESDNQFDNGEGDADDGDQISELCENLYQDSAKCNRNFKTYTGESYQSSNQVEQEDTVCNYITTILSGTYDETGTIIIDANWYFNVSNWKDAAEYMNQVANAKKFASENLEPYQIALLVIIPFACLVMCIWVCCLHSSLRRRNIPWKPRRTRDMSAADISRQNSGIFMGRSHSGGPGTAPLI